VHCCDREVNDGSAGADRQVTGICDRQAGAISLGGIAAAFAVASRVTFAAASPSSSHHARKIMTTTLNERPGLPGSVENDRRPEPPGFLSAYPGYRGTALLDELRATEYAYLDEGGHVYLDYTGAGLPAQAQLAAHAGRLHGGASGTRTRKTRLRPRRPN
jgi:hypothetical protein